MAKKDKKKRRGCAAAVGKDQNRHADNIMGYTTTDLEFLSIDKPGEIEMDILPYEVSVDDHPLVEAGDLFYCCHIHVHFGIGPDNRAFLCPQMMNKGKCAVCDYRTALAKDPDADEALIKDMAPKHRVLYNVEVDGKRYLFDYSWHTFGKYLKQELNAKEKYLTFADLEEGYTLVIRWSKEKNGRYVYYEANRIDFEEREDLDEDILDEVADLDTILNFPSYDDVASILGTPTDGDDEDKPRKRRKRRDKDEDDGDDESPRKRRKRRDKDEDDGDDLDMGTPKDKDDDGDDEDKPKDKDDDGDTEVCPNDYTFGKDNDKHDECDDCDIWKMCAQAKKKMKKEKKRRRG